MDTRTLRKRLGFTQEQLAQACNVSVSTTRAWDQGVRTPQGAALRLLQHLDKETPPARRVNPTVATVAGIRVVIFYNDHAPPHVHLSKGDMDVVVPIDEPTLPSWAFTRAERRAVLDWIKRKAADLRAAWARAGEGTHPGKVDAS